MSHQSKPAIPVFATLLEFDIAVSNCIFLEQLLKSEPEPRPVKGNPNAWVLQGSITTPQHTAAALKEMGRYGTDAMLERVHGAEDSLCCLTIYAASLEIITDKITFYNVGRHKSNLEERMRKRSESIYPNGVMPYMPARTRSTYNFVMATRRLQHGTPVPWVAQER